MVENKTQEKKPEQKFTNTNNRQGGGGGADWKKKKNNKTQNNGNNVQIKTDNVSKPAYNIGSDVVNKNVIPQASVPKVSITEDKPAEKFNNQPKKIKPDEIISFDKIGDDQDKKANVQNVDLWDDDYRKNV